MQTEKKWGRAALILTLVGLLLLGGFTALVDPVFHYHKPLDNLSYYIFDQRYQNDGIVKHFDYNAIITGTSMAENFRASELDALFGVNTVKVPFSGTSLRELGDNLRRAFRANDGIEMVVMNVDGINFDDDKDVLRSDVPLPAYLYDDNLLNDVSYLLNKDILLKYTMRMLQQTYYGLETTDFDRYSYVDHIFEHGPQVVLEKYGGRKGTGEPAPLTPEKAERLRQNIRQNLVQLAKEQPDTVFYFYYPPYSALYWNLLLSAGELEAQIEAYRIATEELLSCSNVRLYSFFDQHQWAEDLQLYRDYLHHNAEINSEILRQLPRDTFLLTEENYRDHWDRVQEYYQNFDFDAFFATYGW